MKARVVRPKWLSQESYEPKYQRLLRAIRAECREGRDAVLVGVSAGASVGLLVFTEVSDDILAFVRSVALRTYVNGRDNRDLTGLSWFKAANRAELVHGR